MNTITVEQSGAFVDVFELPPTRSGPLDGLRFAVKDLIDVAGRIAGCGNPDWLATHSPAHVSAVCVDALLAAGATCVGKAVCDELAFSLIGENHFYGTPLNPRAPDRVPGGSSSGSASAVACGLADFALATDTAGSIRIPASNCSLWGMRPTWGAVSLAGVMPFAPSFDTVGVLAASSEVLQTSMSVLAGDAVLSTVPMPEMIHLVSDAFQLADSEVQQALRPVVDRLRAMFGPRVRETSLADLCGHADAADFARWIDTFRVVRGCEVDSCLGGWIAATQPTFGPAATASFQTIREIDRFQVSAAIAERNHLANMLRGAIGPRDLLCIPTSPTIAPIKGAASHDRHSDYYTRMLSLTTLAGLAQLPQVSMPLADVAGVPIGLSLIASRHQDPWLLGVVRTIDRNA